VADWDDVRRRALALPQTEEGTSWGNLAWKVKGKLFVWERPLRKTDLAALGDAAPDGPILGLKVEHLVAKEALLGSDPDVYFTTPHFDGHAIVLARLERLGPEELDEIVAEAWLAAAPPRLAKEWLETQDG